MSIKEEVRKEVEKFKSWASEANMQAHLAQSELSSEFRTLWMEAEQNVAKLEAKIEDLAEDADGAAKNLLRELQEKTDKLRKSIND